MMLFLFLWFLMMMFSHEIISLFKENLARGHKTDQQKSVSMEEQKKQILKKRCTALPVRKEKLYRRAVVIP